MFVNIIINCALAHICIADMFIIQTHLTRDIVDSLSYIVYKLVACYNDVNA